MDTRATVISRLGQDWSALSMAARLLWLTMLFGSVLAYWLPDTLQALNTPTAVQDDARDHVFWMQRYDDPQLFAGDFVAGYFESVSPWGFAALYRIADMLGVAPFQFAKLLPIALALISAPLAFLATLEIVASPVAAFSSALLLSQYLALNNSVPSGTPRAFAVPLLLLFLLLWLRGRYRCAAASVILQATFYPHMTLVSAGTAMLSLIDPRRRRENSSNEQRRIVTGAILVVAAALLSLLPYAVKSSGYGPTVTRAEAAHMPEFQQGARAQFFEHDTLTMWISSDRAGLLPRLNQNNPIIFLAVALALVQVFGRDARARYRHLHDLQYVAIASIGLYLLAHLLAFRLHNPSRFSQFPLFMLLNLWAGLGIAQLLQAATSARLQPLRTALGVGVLLLLTLLPAWRLAKGYEFPNFNFRTRVDKSLCEFLRTTPKQSLIASVSRQADYLPTLAARPVLVAHEYALPYQLGYYREFRQRAVDLLNAQYSTQPEVLRDFILRYRVAYFVLDPDAYAPGYTDKTWIREYLGSGTPGGEMTTQVPPRLPVLMSLTEHCTVLRTLMSTTVDASCVLTRLQ